MIDQAGGQVELIVTDRDRYDRMIAEIYAGGQFTQEVLVQEGLAWSYRQFHRNCPSAELINQTEAQARQQQVGVFSGGHIEPWKWRRGVR